MYLSFSFVFKGLLWKIDAFAQGQCRIGWPEKCWSSLCWDEFSLNFSVLRFVSHFVPSDLMDSVSEVMG